MEEFTLFDDYLVREVDEHRFFEFFDIKRKEIFFEDNDFRFMEVLSQEEKSARIELRERLKSVFALYWWICRADEVIGWSFGRQESVDTYYMVNTALFPEFQGKGIYKTLLPVLLSRIQRAGFQIVTSNHKASNNRVIVPKLKAGFTITGITVSDIFGLHLQLSYYFNEARKKALDFRVGTKLDERIEKHFGSL